MRVILFRGYSKYNNIWYYGLLGKFDGKYYIECDGGVKPFVEENSVGQYTGFDDSKGNKIFEGDVINWDTDYYGYIDYSDAKFKIEPETLDLTDYQLKDIAPICEVVSNKYEDTRYVKE